MRKILMLASCVCFLASAAAQSREEFIEYFDEAEYFFNRDEFEEAAYYYRKVLQQYPDNANFNFKLGSCYLNIPGSESLAVPYLEKAVTKTVEKNKYRPKAFEEKNAPLHAYFYLGNAYRFDNQLDKALTAYQTFINSPWFYGNYNENIVENEVKTCERAKIIQDSPVSLTEILLPGPVNSEASELHPVISGDQKTIVFIRKLKFYDAILLCRLEDDRWSEPLNLNPLVGSDGDFYPACLSADGKELYLVKTSSGGGDLYVSFYRNNTWTRAEKLGGGVNSGANESAAWLTEDGQMLYFSSDRGSGKGGLDIFTAKRTGENQWGKAKNAGKSINTVFDEDSPCLVNYDKTLYFSSKGHYSMGGFDLFYAPRDGKKWSAPVNVGYPVNNTGNNNNMVVTRGGSIIYLSKTGPDGNNGPDLYKIEILSSVPHP